MANQQQLMTMGVIIGFVDGQPDLVRVSDGFNVIVAYLPQDRNEIRPGQCFNLYKQNSLYMLGTELQSQ